MPEPVSDFNYEGDYEYARTRLEGTVVLHNGIPRMCHQVWIDSGNCLLYPLGSNNTYTAHVNELVVNDYKLGYMNSGKSLYYLTRMPKKQYKQGIREDTIWDSIQGLYIDPYYKGMANTLMGVYPSIKSSIELVECEDVEGCAFHRNFAIQRKDLGGYRLYFKGTKRVGILYLTDFGQPKVDLFDDYTWLEETVEEAI